MSLRARRGGGWDDAGRERLRRPCAPTSGEDEGLPTPSQDWACPSPGMVWATLK